MLLRAASGLIPEAQLVLLAGAADTPEQLAEVTELVDGLRATRSGVIWIPEMLPKPEVIQLLTHATVFAIPSVYEPLGIVNLEAMACGTAVAGSRTGGIPEVVADGETGLLVPPGDPPAACGRPERPAARSGPGPGHGAGRPQARGGGIRLARYRRPDRRSLRRIGTRGLKLPFIAGLA